ncbi:MAG: PAS domain-containing protein [Bacteroidota bacterium]|nr:PAS domain-containing protein [Bacteroidota bacterium]
MTERMLRDMAPTMIGGEMLLVTETGRIVFANRLFCERLGYTTEEIRRVPITEIDRSMSRGAWLSTYVSLRKSGRMVGGVTEHHAKNGSVLRKRMTCGLVTVEGSHFVLCVGDMLENAPTQDGRDSGSHATSKNDSDFTFREQALMAAVSDAVLIVNEKGEVMEANNAALRLFDQHRAEIIGRSCTDSRWRLADERGNALRISEHPIMIALVSECAVTGVRVAHMLPGGSHKVLAVNVQPLIDTERRLRGAVAVFREVGPSGQAGKDREARGLLEAADAIYRALACATTREEIERRVCEILTGSAGYSLAWFGDRAANDLRIHPTTSAGPGADFLLKVKLRYDDTPQGDTSIGLCVKSGKAQTVRDTQHDRSFVPWKKQAEQCGIRSLLCLPLVVDGVVTGLFSVGSPEVDAFDEGETALLGEIAAAALNARLSVESRRKIRDLEEQATLRQVVLDAVFDTSDEAVCVFESMEPFRCTAANAAFTRMLDEPFRTTGVRDFYLSDFVFAHRQSDLFERVSEAAEKGEPVSGEFETHSDEGRPLRAVWSLIPVKSGRSVGSIVYRCAIRQPAAVERLAEEIPEPGETVNEIPIARPFTAGFVKLEAPTPSIRARKEKRAELLFDQGKVTSMDPIACRLLGIDPRRPVRNRPAGEILPRSEIFRERVLEAFSAKGKRTAFECTTTHGTAPCRCTVSVEPTSSSKTIVTVRLEPS